MGSGVAGAGGGDAGEEEQVTSAPPPSTLEATKRLKGTEQADSCEAAEMA